LVLEGFWATVPQDLDHANMVRMRMAHGIVNGKLDARLVFLPAIDPIGKEASTHSVHPHHDDRDSQSSHLPLVRLRQLRLNFPNGLPV
jgi:hypothetical protein